MTDKELLILENDRLALKNRWQIVGSCRLKSRLPKPQATFYHNERSCHPYPCIIKKTDLYHIRKTNNERTFFFEKCLHLCFPWHLKQRGVWSMLLAFDRKIVVHSYIEGKRNGEPLTNGHER